MKKILVSAALFVAVVAGATLAQAQVFDDETGTVTVMASGGTVYEDHTATAQTITGGLVAASLTLPAGRYEVVGKAVAVDLSSGANFVQCGLTGLGINENGRASIVASGSATLAVLGTVDLSVETDVELFCNPNAAAKVEMTVLTATTVSAIISQ